MIVVSVSVILLALFSVDYKGLKNNNSLGFSKDNTAAFRGLLALTIVLCHMTAHTDYKIPLFNFSVMGSMSVGAFFLLSGYALYKSTAKYKNYLDNFLYKRFIKIAMPFIVMLIIYVLLVCIIAGEPVKDVIDSFIYGYPISNSWYVLTSLYLYFVYWLSFRKNGKDEFFKSFIKLFLAIVIYCAVVIFVFKWPDWWYKTVFVFPLGIIFAKYEEKIKAILNKKYVIAFIITLGLVGFSYIFPAISNRIFNKEIPYIWLINDVLMAFTFAIFTVVLLNKFNFNNKITTFLGKISYEIYLFHGLVMNFLESKIINFPMATHMQQELYAIVVFAATILLAVIFNKCSAVIIPKMLKKGK